MRDGARRADVEGAVSCNAAKEGGINVCGTAEAEAAEFSCSQAERAPRGVKGVNVVPDPWSGTAEPPVTRSCGLCPLKVCAGTTVARQSNDLRDEEVALFLGNVDGLADGREDTDAVEQDIAGGRRHAEEEVLFLGRSGRRGRRLLLGPDVDLHFRPRPLLREQLSEL